MMTMDALIPAFLLGLMGAGHCLGMCGGVAAALSFANTGRSKQHQLFILLMYNVGRILSYGFLGALFAFLLGGVEKLSPVPILRVVSGLLLVAMGLYLADWWRVLSRLEALGAGLWKFISPIASRLMPARNLRSALMLGLLWGWLPCGLVYSVLSYASAQGEILSGALVMIAFGVGTLPAVLAGGLASKFVNTLVSKRWLRVVFGIGFIGYGLVTLVPVVTLALVALGVSDAPMNVMHHH